MSLTLYRDDVVAGLARLRPGSVDMVLTDPPVAIYLNERGRTERTKLHFEWLAPALAVCRGPVIYTLGPEVFLAWQDKILKPDILMSWLIDRSSERQPAGRASIGSDWNVICVHRPGQPKFATSDVLLAKPGPRESKIEVRGKQLQHPAPGSFELAKKICEAWAPKSVLDPFSGIGVVLEGAAAAGVKDLYGIEIDHEYADLCRARFTDLGHMVTLSDHKPDMALQVGR